MKPFDPLHVPLEGTCLVEASAGTGKTYAISTLFVRHLLESGLSVGQILVVTFTEAATSELRDRIRRRLQETVGVCDALKAKQVTSEHDATLVALVSRQGHLGLAKRALSEALLRFDSAAIFTIHGFCQRVLRENAFATRVPFEADLLQDVRPLVDELLTDFWLGRLRDAPMALVRSLYESNFTPSFPELLTFANFVAQAPQLQLLPAGEETPLPLQQSRVQAAFERAQAAFDEPVLRRLLTPVYANQRHLASRLEPLAAFFSLAYGDTPFPREKAAWFYPDKLRSAAKKCPAPVHAFFDAIQDLADEIEALEACVREHVRQLKRAMVTFLQQEMERRKSARGLLSFDDLLLHLFRALETPEGPRLASSLRSQYRAALIDEFQDTDPIQYGVFRAIFQDQTGYDNAATSLFLIGDPKQAIYSFRGADVFAYMEAAQAVAASRRFTMTTNYRSDEALVQAVNGLFGRHPQPFYFPELEYPLVQARHTGSSALQPFADNRASSPVKALEFRFIAREPDSSTNYARHALDRGLPQRVALHVQALLDSGEQLAGRSLTPKDIAILTRTNREAFDCQRSLARLGIACVVQGDRSVFEQPEAREMQLVLAAAAEPNRSTSIRTALATSLLGQTASDLDALAHSEDAWDAWVERFQGYAERWRNEGFIQMVRQLLLDCRVAQRLLRQPMGERRMTNVLHLIELLHTQATGEHLGPSGLLQYLAEQRTRVTTPTESEQVRLESDEDAVVLTTIHKSKGLEYPITFCPFLFGSALPRGRQTQWVEYHDPATRKLCVDIGTEQLLEHSELKARESLSENLRLLYVALTRARHRCIVYWGALGIGFQDSALAYLLYGSVQPDGRPESNAQQTKKADDEQLLAPLMQLAQHEAGVSVFIEPPLADSPEPSAPDTGRVRAPSTSDPRGHGWGARQVETRVTRWMRTASFTELTRNAPTVHGPASPASDHDELVAEHHDELEPRDARAALNAECSLAGFPGGATVGNFFHHVLEHLDFRQPPDLGVLRQALLAHGLAPELGEQALAGLLDALATEFAADLSLDALPTACRLNELEFMFPVGDGGQRSALTSRRLAMAFKQAPSDVVPASYANAVEALPFSFLQGFLRGFVDLIFTHQGRWYLVDYKTNHLGSTYAHYQPKALLHCMTNSHYLLQYHIYGLALHRYLQLRLPDYEYDEHFGGVYYLFLRGMSPKLGSRSGVFYDKPPLDRLLALQMAFEDSAAPTPAVEQPHV